MKRHILTAALLAATALAAASRTSAIDSLAHAIALADPATQARHAELRAASLAMQAETSLPGLEAEGEHLWGRGGDNRWGLGISQSFDWPGVYAARRSAAREAGDAFAMLARAEMAERSLSAKLTLIDLVAARRRAATVGRIAGNLRRLTELTRTALDRGQATILDLRKLEIALLETELRLEQAELTRAEAIGSLRAMGFSGEVPEGLAYPDPADATEAAARWEAMPSVMAARAEARAAEARAKAAGRSMMPGFSLGYRHQFEGGNHFNGLSVGIALPAWGSGKARKAARAEAEAASLMEEARLSEHNAALATALRKLPGLEARMKAYDSALSASDYVGLLEKSLNGGQISVLSYIQELNFFLEAEMARIDAEQQYHTALAGLCRFNSSL